MDLDHIEVAGDYPLEEVRAKSEGFELCMEHIDDYFGREASSPAQWDLSRKRTHETIAGAAARALFKKPYT